MTNKKTKDVYPYTSVQHYMEFVPRAIKQGKEIKCILNGKEGVKVSLFTDNISLSAENLKEYIHIKTNTTNTFSKLQVIRSKRENNFFFYVLPMNYLEMKSRK
jgi:hypothetical protein